MGPNQGIRYLGINSLAREKFNFNLKNIKHHLLQCHLRHRHLRAAQWPRSSADVFAAVGIMAGVGITRRTSRAPPQRNHSPASPPRPPRQQSTNSQKPPLGAAAGTLRVEHRLTNVGQQSTPFLCLLLIQIFLYCCR